jgi:hypothetical protein
MSIPTLRPCHFEASEDIIPALWNIGILLHKQATLGKHFYPECMTIVPNVQLRAYF